MAAAKPSLTAWSGTLHLRLLPRSLCSPWLHQVAMLNSSDEEPFMLRLRGSCVPAEQSVQPTCGTHKMQLATTAQQLLAAACRSTLSHLT